MSIETDIQRFKEEVEECETLRLALEPFDEDFFQQMFHEFHHKYLTTQQYDGFYGLKEMANKMMQRRIDSCRMAALESYKKLEQ